MQFTLWNISLPKSKNGKAIPVQLRGLQEVEASRILKNRHLKVKTVVALYTFTPREDPRYSFLLQAESTLGPE